MQITTINTDYITMHYYHVKNCLNHKKETIVDNTDLRSKQINSSTNHDLHFHEGNLKTLVEYLEMIFNKLYPLLIHKKKKLQLFKVRYDAFSGVYLYKYISIILVSYLLIMPISIFD